MYIVQIFLSAFENIKANKLRSFLTMLGIIIGISSVITIASIGGGIKEYVIGEFAGMGSNSINLQIDTSKDIGKRDYFTLEDAQLVQERVPEVTAVVPIAEAYGTVEVEDKSKTASFEALNDHYPEILKVDMLYGRFLNGHDVDTKKNVGILDETSAKKFFKSPEKAVGQKIKLNMGDKYLDLTVIGVIKNQNIMASFGDSMPAIVYFPITIQDRIMTGANIGYMSVLVKDISKADEISKKIIRIIENKHKNSGKYSARQGFAELDMIDNVLNMLTAALSAIAGISLVVGGIGVMNIMLVSVTERTREIGILKAVGAKTKDIRTQFLLESVILCLFGGIIGMLLGIGFSKLIAASMNAKIPVSLFVILIAFAFSSAVGIFFGIYPANKAAKLDPIEALRHE
ncbi:MAG: ABC transporter permease [Solirubrobacterales bacterium]